MFQVLEPLPARPRSQKHRDEAATLRILNGFAIDLMAIPSVEDLFWYVAQKVVGKLNFIDCVIYQADEDQTVLTQVAAWGEKNPFARSIVNPLVIPFGTGITGGVAQDREAMIVEDLLKDQNYIPDTEPARSEICVPLVIGNRVMGVIDSEHPDPGAFDSTELEILTTVAAMTSAKLALLEEAERSARRYQDLAIAHAQLSEEKSSRKALEARLSEVRKMEAIGRLSGQFAHDFNNLLTVISGNLEFLESEITHPDAVAFLHDGRTAAARGAKLISDMLAFSQRMKLNPEVSDLNLLAVKACERFDLTSDTEIATEFADDLLAIRVDRKAVEDALINLITNARDAMPENGIRITTDNVSHDRRDNQALSNDLEPGRYVRISVQDSGSGISQKDRLRIFDPFYTTKPVGSGVGLGLSMILGFMQQSGGAVRVESSPGRGSMFQLYFPAAVQDPNELLTVRG